MKEYFVLVLVLWTVVVAFHAWRLVWRRHPMSAAACVYPLGWAFFAGREAHILGLEVAHVGTALSLVFGALAAALCVTSWVAEWSRR